MPHIHEKIDFTVEVFVVYKGRVLLRKHDKYDLWLSVGGHVELDEDPNQAAIREVKEEVGLDIELYDTRKVLTNRTDLAYQDLIPPIGLLRMQIPTRSAHEHVVSVYFASATTDEVSPESPMDQWRWCAKEDLASVSPVTEDIVQYSMLAIDTLGGNA